MDVTQKLAATREELSFINDQLSTQEESTDVASLKSAVAETPLASAELNNAKETVEGIRRARATVEESILELEAAQGELLEQLLESGTNPDVS